MLMTSRLLTQQPTVSFATSTLPLSEVKHSTIRTTLPRSGATSENSVNQKYATDSHLVLSSSSVSVNDSSVSPTMATSLWQRMSRNPAVHYGSTRKVQTRFLTWEEFLGRMAEFEDLSDAVIAPDEDMMSPRSGASVGGSVDQAHSSSDRRRHDTGDTSRRTSLVPGNGLILQGVLSTLGSPSGEAFDRNKATLIVTLTVVVTSLIAAFIIVIIVRLCRRQKAAAVKKPARCESLTLSETQSRSLPPSSSAAVVRNKPKKDVLYFMSPRSSAKQNNTNYDKTTTETVVVVTPGGKKPTTEVMALVSGRDINHEGPLRVYKWEDF